MTPARSIIAAFPLSPSVRDIPSEFYGRNELIWPVNRSVYAKEEVA